MYQNRYQNQKDERCTIQFLDSIEAQRGPAANNSPACLWCLPAHAAAAHVVHVKYAHDSARTFRRRFRSNPIYPRLISPSSRTAAAIACMLFRSLPISLTDSQSHSSSKLASDLRSLWNFHAHRSHDITAEQIDLIFQRHHF